MPDIFDGSAQQSAEEKITPPSKEEVLDAVKARRAEDTSKRKPCVDEYSQVMEELEPTTTPLTAFAAKPPKTAFSAQARNEEILLLLRRHPVTQVKWVLLAFLFAIVPIIFSGIPLTGFLPVNFQLAATIGWYLLLVGFIVQSFLTWYFNVNIVTDERIIDVDFLSLIYHDVASAKIDNIEDVTATTGGALRAVFDFGDVLIQTAAEKNEFVFEDVPHPEKVVKFLNEMMLQEEQEKIEGRVS